MALGVNPGDTLPALPFNNVSPAILAAPGNTALPFTAPGTLSGSSTLDVRTRLLGGEANLVLNRRADAGFRLDLLGGFRYLNLEEELAFTLRNDAGGAAPTFFTTRDEFSTQNHFYGGQLGARASVRRGRWLGELTGKVALGMMHQEVEIGARPPLRG